MRILAIRTDFTHHGDRSGYKQILKFINPEIVIGNDERNQTTRWFLLKKYPWLYEFIAWRKRKQFDLLHILYGEDYFRFSSLLLRHKPVVVTFHQPADVLMKDIVSGTYRGRVGRLTHLITKSRFKRLAAAIVTNPQQAEALKTVMPANKIHYIPLGIHLDNIDGFLSKHSESKKSGRPRVITVGNWLRDWSFYCSVVAKCPQFDFILVNKGFLESEKVQFKQYKNVAYHENVTDELLFESFRTSMVHFLPVTGFAASNAFLQGLALGCATVLTDIDASHLQNKSFIALYERNNLQDAIDKISCYIKATESEHDTQFQNARAYVLEYSWENVANRTIKIYNQLI
jgi:glycosyltransferase involved in cell wall biosynthesis